MSKFAGMISQCVLNGDGTTLADVLDLTRRPPNDATKFIAEYQSKSVDEIARSFLRMKDSYRDVISRYIYAAVRVYRPLPSPSDPHPPYFEFTPLPADSGVDTADAFASVKQAAETLLSRCIPEEKSIWWLPFCMAVLKLVRLCSYYASSDSSNTSGRKALEDANDVLTRFSSNFNLDRSQWDVSKKQGCLFVANHIIKIFFRMHSISLCKNIVKTINLDTLNQYTTAQVVTFRYYLGRLAIIEERYNDAVVHLEIALSKCHKQYTRNIRRILSLLAPTKLLVTGSIPTQRCLALIPHLASLITAICKGDLIAFKAGMITNEDYLVREGVYFLFEKLKAVAQTRLIRRAYMAYRLIADPAKHKMFPLSYALAEMKRHEPTMDLDELECVIAVLIGKKRIKGYIVHGKYVILSLEDPFPKPLRPKT